MSLWWAAVGAVAAVTIVAERLGQAAHAESWWHAVPGFDLVYGFAGCLVTVVVSKALGKWWLQRPEDYYRDEQR